jgi:sn-glycerol 3-phosphate transport system substrate-binding protein
MHKKNISLLFTLLMVIVLLLCTSLSCYDTQSQTDYSNRIKITFWYSGFTPLKVMTDKFNEMQNECYVELSYQGDYGTMIRKILVAAVSQTTPTLAQIEQSLAARLVEYKIATPLDDLMQSDTSFHLDDIIPAMRASCEYDGKMCAIPLNVSAPVLFCNLDMFRQAGLDTKHLPETWEEVYATAKQIKEKTGHPGLDIFIDDWDIENLTWGWGGELLSPDGTEPLFNSAETKEALSFLHKMVAEGVALTTPKDVTVFFSGSAGMAFNSIAWLRGYKQTRRDVKFEVGIAPYPRAKKKIVTSGGANIYLFNGASPEQRKAAWKYLRYLLTPEGQYFVADSTGYMVTTWSAYHSPYIQGIFQKDPKRKVVYEQLPYCVPRPRYGWYNEINDNLIQIYAGAVLGTITPEEALREGEQLTRKIIGEYY